MTPKTHTCNKEKEIRDIIVDARELKTNNKNMADNISEMKADIKEIKIDNKKSNDELREILNKMNEKLLTLHTDFIRQEEFKKEVEDYKEFKSLMYNFVKKIDYKLAFIGGVTTVIIFIINYFK